MSANPQRVTSQPYRADPLRRSRPLSPVGSPAGPNLLQPVHRFAAAGSSGRANLLGRAEPTLRNGLVGQLQRTQGNLHVQRTLAASRPSTPARIRIQRCGATPCNCSPEERAAHAATEMMTETVQRLATIDIAGAIQRSAGGERLHPIARAKLEPAMGLDLGHVTIHRDRNADELARAVDAEAFTTGDHIFFREGRYDPESTPGLRLLAHEITHTVQQGRGNVSGIQHFGGLEINEPGDPHEQEAERTADAVVARLSSAPDTKGGCRPAALKRTASSPAGRRPVIQRAPRTDTAPGFSATWTPFASLNSPPFFFQTNFDTDGFHDEFNVPPKSSGRLIMLADVTWNRGGGGGGGGGGQNAPCTGPGGVPIPQEVVTACDPCPKLPSFLPDPDLQSCFRLPDLCSRRLIADALLTKYTNDPCEMISPNAPFFVQAAKIACKFGVGAFKITPAGAFIFGGLDQIRKVVSAIAANPLCATCCPINPSPGPGPNPGPQPQAQTGKGRATFETRFFVGVDGTIQTVGLPPRIEANGAGAELVSPVEFIRTPIPGGVNVAFQPMIKATGSNETHVFQHQWDIDLKQPAPPAPLPFSFGIRMFPFKTGKDIFEDEQKEQTRLFKWFQTMDPRVRNRIISRQIPVVVAGFASHRGDPAFNLALSEKRAKRVERMVHDFGGSFSGVITFAFGEILAGGGPNDNSPEFRSATTRACGQLEGADAAAGPMIEPAENDLTVCPDTSASAPALPAGDAGGEQALPALE